MITGIHEFVNSILSSQIWVPTFLEGIHWLLGYIFLIGLAVLGVAFIVLGIFTDLLDMSGAGVVILILAWVAAKFALWLALVALLVYLFELWRSKWRFKKGWKKF